MKYRYQPVAGASVWGQPTGLLAALASLRSLNESLTRDGMSDLAGELEIERSLTLLGGGRRYWRQDGSRWRLWSADMAAASVRKPAYSPAKKVA